MGLSHIELERAYFQLGNKLPEVYQDRGFDNHCFWRIALDNVIGDKWNRQVKSPAYKHLSNDQLECVINLLNKYLVDPTLLERHNTNSLAWRGKENYAKPIN